MNQKKAKKLRKIARLFVTQTGKNLSEINIQYKKMKKTYKSNKGEK